MDNTVYIKEIFESVQGEGPYIGYNQLFIRFATCNLDCKYCDTDFKSDLKEYSPEEIIEIINNAKNIHSVSLTGGEPLLNSDFLKSVLPNTKHKIYLETNGTLYKNLSEISDFIDIIAADIKLPSASGNPDLFEIHEKFFKTAVSLNKEIFAKVVFNKNITKHEIETVINTVEKFRIPLILQPESSEHTTNVNTDNIVKTFGTFINRHPDTRLIPQVHKYLNLK